MTDADEPADSARDGGLTRVRLDIAYDGGDFAGWARQPGLRTVQGVVEEALATVLRLPEPPRLTVAGRTDAGVHARGQVAHVDLPQLPDGLQRRLHGVLDPDVRVHAVSRAPAGFDARFCALSRAYRYRLTDAVPDPLRRHDTVAHPRALDADAMATAAAALLGEHDFAAYCRRREGATTIRTLLRLDVSRRHDQVIAADVEADAFCHTMVRSLLGALLVVGEGRRPVGWPAQLLAGGVRDPAAPVAPAHGLTLVAVRYPPDAELAERARTTRQRRAGL